MEATEQPAIGQVDPEAMSALVELENQVAQRKQADVPKVETKSDAAPSGVTDPKVESEPKTEQLPDTLSEAEKQEVETAKGEAEKEGKELALDGAGKPKRDEQGKFVKQDKKPVEQPVKLTKEEEEKFLKWSKQRGSKYAHDLEKKLIRWDKIKEAEAAVETNRKAQEQKLNGAISKFNADVAAFQAQRSATTPTPEKFQAFAKQCSDQAKVKRAEAITAEAAGDFDKAEALKKEAVILEADADRAGKSAEHLAKNPPPSQKQQQEKFVADQRTWIQKAAIDYPEFGKRDSELYAKTVETFKSFTQQHPEAAKLPGLIYYCARMTQAETAAAKVPAMLKELGELRTRVKDQDALLNPSPGGGAARISTGPKKFSSMTTKEKQAALLAEAAEMA